MSDNFNPFSFTNNLPHKRLNQGVQYLIWVILNLLIKLIHFVYFMDCFEGIIISLCNESVLTPWYRVSYLFNNNTELLRRLVIIENQK